MATATTKKRVALPLPFDVSEARAGELYLPDYQKFAIAGREYGQKHKLRPAATDKFKIAVVTIDGQIDFCQQRGALYVIGAEADMARTCEFKMRNMDLITTLINTMDTHTAFQVFHESFLVNDAGEHPMPFTAVSADDVIDGKWKVNPQVPYVLLGDPSKYMAIQHHLMHYCKSLKARGRYELQIWPYHCMIESPGHALTPLMAETDHFIGQARGHQAHTEIKGGNPLSENYSPFELEVATMADGKPLGQKNTRLLNAIVSHDATFIVGQAKSHCVAWAIDSILEHINAQDPALAKKIYLVEDCTSSVKIPGVIDFSPQGDAAFQRFADAGMNKVQSATPLEDYLPL